VPGWIQVHRSSPGLANEISPIGECRSRTTQSRPVEGPQEWASRSYMQSRASPTGIGVGGSPFPGLLWKLYTGLPSSSREAASSTLCTVVIGDRATLHPASGFRRWRLLNSSATTSQPRVDLIEDRPRNWRGSSAVTRNVARVEEQ
jgi:hypothetical protein